MLLSSPQPPARHSFRSLRRIWTAYPLFRRVDHAHPIPQGIHRMAVNAAHALGRRPRPLDAPRRPVPREVEAPPQRPDQDLVLRGIHLDEPLAIPLAGLEE